VGVPLTLTAWARRDNPYGTPIVEGFTPMGSGEDDRPIRFTWFKHQGLGDVVFAPERVDVPREAWRGSPDALGEARAQATFLAPGDYVLRVLVYNQPTSFTHFCCWTNGYVRVQVTP
jgi:hypothetical protein